MQDSGVHLETGPVQQAVSSWDRRQESVMLTGTATAQKSQSALTTFEHCYLRGATLGSLSARGRARLWQGIPATATSTGAPALRNTSRLASSSFALPNPPVGHTARRKAAPPVSVLDGRASASLQTAKRVPPWNS